MSKALHRNLQAKMDKLQGSEWDSSDEETKEKVVPKVATKKERMLVGRKGTKTDNTKKTNSHTKKQEDAVEETERDATVLFIGHLPNEFEERDLRNFLQQFGKLVNIRISRSVTSGKSRGYAFVRWQDAETAKIVAETLQGYLVGGHRLVCHTVPNPSKHVFFNTDKVIEQRKIRRQVDEKKRAQSLENTGKIKEITARLIKRERKKRAKLEELGIDYDFPGYEASQMMNEDHDEEKMDEEIKQVPNQSEKEGARKRKESIDGVGSSSSATKKRKDTVGIQGSVVSEAKNLSSAKKPKKENKKRRDSAP